MNTSLLCYPVTRVTPSLTVRIAPGVWAQECEFCGDILTRPDIGATRSALSLHITRNHGIRAAS